MMHAQDQSRVSGNYLVTHQTVSEDHLRIYLVSLAPQHSGAANPAVQSANFNRSHCRKIYPLPPWFPVRVPHGGHFGKQNLTNLLVTKLRMLPQPIDFQESPEGRPKRRNSTFLGPLCLEVMGVGEKWYLSAGALPLY